MFRCISCNIPQRKLNKKENKKKFACLVEKAVLCAAESSRHSGIVRSANADPDASMMAMISTKMWKNLSEVWGLDMELMNLVLYGLRKKILKVKTLWNDLSKRMNKINLVFEEINSSSKKNAK